MSNLAYKMLNFIENETDTRKVFYQDIYEEFCADYRKEKIESQIYSSLRDKHIFWLQPSDSCWVWFIDTYQWIELTSRWKIYFRSLKNSEIHIDAKYSNIWNIWSNNWTINITTIKLNLEDIENIESIITDEYKHHEDIHTLLDEYKKSLEDNNADEWILSKIATYIWTFNDASDFVEKLKNTAPHILTLFAKYSPEIEQAVAMCTQ